MRMSDRLDELRQRFRDRAATHAVELEDALRTGDNACLTQIAHRLSGSGGTFGYPEIGRLAETVERAADTELSTTQLKCVVRALIEAIRRMSQDV